MRTKQHIATALIVAAMLIMGYVASVQRDRQSICSTARLRSTPGQQTSSLFLVNAAERWGIQN
jgi:hypothetical protein